MSATIVSRAGGEANQADKPGLASFTAAMLGEGTERLSATELAEAAERLGTRVGAFAGMDSSTASVSVLTTRSAAALDLLADVIEHPAFKDADIDRIRRQRVLGIQPGGRQCLGDRSAGWPPIALRRATLRLHAKRNDSKR